MICVLVTKESTVVSKDVYVGDDDASMAKIEELKRKNLDLTYTVVDENTFGETAMSLVQTKDQRDWITAKSIGTSTAISFLAKKLGLE